MTSTQLDDQLSAARQRVSDIAEKILTVDDDSTAAGLTEDLLSAEAEVNQLETAVARRDAILAERSVRRAEAARQQRFRELDELITQEFGVEDAEILTALDKATEAMAELVTRVWRHNRGFAAIAAEIIDLGPAPFSSETNYQMLSAGGGQIHLPAHDVFLQKFDIQKLAAEVAWSAMLEVGPSNGEEQDATAALQALAGAEAVIDPDVMAKYNCGRDGLPYSARIRYDAAVVAERTVVA